MILKIKHPACQWKLKHSYHIYYPRGILMRIAIHSLQHPQTAKHQHSIHVAKNTQRGLPWQTNNFRLPITNGDPVTIPRLLFKTNCEGNTLLHQRHKPFSTNHTKFKGTNKPGNILVTMDVKSLYTNKT